MDLNDLIEALNKVSKKAETLLNAEQVEMNFKREKINNYYLHDTAVENVFINEFLPVAPGGFCQGLFVCPDDAGISVSINNESIAKQLSMPVETS